jgi:hypothetical protein
MRKYEDVDIIAALGAVVELNTEHYKGDLKYDIEMFKDAVKNPDGESNRLLWFSRHSGTHCLQEREVYIRDTSAFNTWNAYGKMLGSPDFYRPVIVEDRILAYAVKVTGIENGRIKGDLYELDYRDHIRQLDKQALPRHTVTATYKDGTTVTMPPKEHDSVHLRLHHQHGQLQTYKSHPQDEQALRDVLQQVRDKRENESRPAVFKVGVRRPKQTNRQQPGRDKQPSIKEQIAAGKKQLADQRAAAPARTAAKSKNTGLGD